MRFFGTLTYLSRWREIVKEVTGKQCSEIVFSEKSIHRFDVDLTDDDRDKIFTHWGSETDVPDAKKTRWWLCITFSKI